MKTLRKFQEKQNKEFKKNAILKWMASFSVTVVVAATVVIQQQKANPSVSFDRLSAVGTTIVYQTTITDPDQTIIKDSLLLEFSSSLERYELPLTLGVNQGTFSMRYPQSKYTLTVKGSQGFGEKPLATETVTSLMRLSGAITDYTLLNRVTDSFLIYEVSTILYDPDQVIKNLQLRFGYFENYYAHDPNAVPTNDQVFPITSSPQTVVLPEIPNENYSVFLTLEGTKTDDTPVILDVVRFKTPLKIYGELYITDLGPQYLSVSAYVSEYRLLKEEVSVRL